MNNNQWIDELGRRWPSTPPADINYIAYGGVPEQKPVMGDFREFEKDAVSFDTFCDFIVGEADRIAEIVQEKQADYGPKAVTRSPISPEVGLLTRMSDKLFRIENLLLKNGDSMVAEAIEDTLDDIAGYALLWLAYRAGQLDYDPEG